MPRKMLMFMLLVFLGCMAGCEPADPYLEVFREQDAARKELIGILRGIQDEAGMKTAKVEIVKRVERVEEIGVRAKKLLRPGRDALERLEKERPKMEKTMQELLTEAARIKKLPGGERFMSDLEQLRAAP